MENSFEDQQTKSTLYRQFLKMANPVKSLFTTMWAKVSQDKRNYHHSLLTNYSSPTISPSTTVTNFSSIQSIQSFNSSRSVQSRIPEYYPTMGIKEQNMIIGASEIAPLNEEKCVVQMKGASINAEYSSPYKTTTVEEEDFPTTSPTKHCYIFKQLLAALSVSIGAMTVGFCQAYTSPAIVSMNDPNSTRFMPVSKIQESWIGSLMPLSALVGGIIGGSLIEYVGRKSTILLTAFPFIASWLVIAMANEVEMLYYARVISGFCVGVVSLAFPVYLGETLQPEVRGMLGLLPTALGNIGMLVAFAAGSFLNWSYLAMLGACLPVPFLILMFVIPETPRWYLSKGKKVQAEQALVWLRGKSADVSQELREIQKTQAEADKQSSNSGGVELFKIQYLKPLLISLGLMFFQQLSGINAVVFYTVSIFKDAGSTIDPNVSTIIVGIVNFLSTFVATLLIDRLGRKILLYVSSFFMTITLVTLSIFFYMKNLIDVSEYGWIPLASFVIFVIAFSLGFGPIPWLMMGEILPAKIRGPAASVATAFNWACTFIVTKSFQDLQILIGSYGAFGVFAVFCFTSMFFTYFFVPETQGRTLEDIEKALTGAKVRRMSSVMNIKPMPSTC